MGKTVVVVGAGAREHALAHRLADEGCKVFSAPGNAGSARVGEILPIEVSARAELVAAAKRLSADLVVIGPEAPLVGGLADKLRKAGLTAFGPSQAAAQIEGSKVFAKELMASANVPTAGFRVFDDVVKARAYIRKENRPLVVKADGLAGGKGVVVADDADEACDAVHSMLVDRAFGEAGSRVLVEDRMAGPEISYHAVCDGERFVPLVAAQDHKRALDGDRGPNTGGMGAYSPPPMLDAALEAQIQERVVQPVLAQMAKQGTPFRGVLFVGLMIVDGAPKVLEFNARFGDPECQVLLARLESSLYELLLGSARGDLSGYKLSLRDSAAMTVVLASRGYPRHYSKGHVITGLEEAAAMQDVTVYHAGTQVDGANVVTAGGRVLSVTATGADIDVAAERAYAACDRIDFEGKQLRRDIGHQARTR